MTIFWKEQKRLPILFCDSTATCKINKQPKSITQMKDQTHVFLMINDHFWD